MKVEYDKKYDIAYIQFSNKKPDGAVEIEKLGIALDTTKKGEIIGIEVFDASHKIPLQSLSKLTMVSA